MVYIYKDSNNNIQYQRNTVPSSDFIIELERMIPMPVKEGYISILNANFDTKEVWYDFQITLEQAKIEKEQEILAYGSSKEVDGFYINGDFAWLDKLTRNGLNLRFISEKSAGATETTLWNDKTHKSYPLNIDMAIQMLYAIDNYASACFDNTQKHIATMYELNTLEEVQAYEYKTGFPPMLEFGEAPSSGDEETSEAKA